MQRLVVNVLFQEVTDHHNQKDGSREAQTLYVEEMIEIAEERESSSAQIRTCQVLGVKESYASRGLP